jgi:hypothetical protein
MTSPVTSLGSAPVAPRMRPGGPANMSGARGVVTPETPNVDQATTGRGHR